MTRVTASCFRQRVTVVGQFVLAVAALHRIGRARYRRHVDTVLGQRPGPERRVARLRHRIGRQIVFADCRVAVDRVAGVRQGKVAAAGFGNVHSVKGAAEGARVQQIVPARAGLRDCYRASLRVSHNC